MKPISKINRIFSLFILFLFLFCFTACRLKAEQKSLTDQFITIDTLIEQNKMNLAIEELKDAEKRSSDVWSYLGVYKRYTRLGESELAEKCLKKAIKKDSKNEELNAVYTDFLINENRYEEAVKFGRKLIDTKYSSVYSEAVLRLYPGLTIKNNDFDFYNVYYDAYLVTRNPIWIRNCAVLDMLLGHYERISDLLPKAFADVDDAYFWALALYDAGKYYESIDAAEKAQSMLNDYGDSISDMFKTSKIDLIALLSDSYMSVSDMETAEKIRKSLIFDLKNIKKSDLNNNVLPVIITNSAIWAYNQGLDDECADLLFYVVNKWPDFAPGLILYSDYAYNSNLQRQENMEMKLLREAGLASVEMEEYDNRRKIPLSDAQYRIESSLERTNDPFLRIVQLDLKYKTDETLTTKEKTANLWNMLENSYTEGEKYKTLLVQYALNFLLMTDQVDDAWGLFQDYVIDNIEYDGELEFWDQFITNVRSFDVGIVEFGAWFAAYKKLYTEAIRLNEYCVYESGGLLEDGYIAQNVSTATCMNLGDIYYSTGKKDKALDLYGRIGGRESKKSLRSDIFYRIACIYSSIGDKKNALRSAEYACELYPENSRASLLKDSIRTN